MKAKIHIALNDGQAVELEAPNVNLVVGDWWDGTVEGDVSYNLNWDNIKELTIKPIHDAANPNADVKQTFPKGRW